MQSMSQWGLRALAALLTVTGTLQVGTGVVLLFEERDVNLTDIACIMCGLIQAGLSQVIIFIISKILLFDSIPRLLVLQKNNCFCFFARRLRASAFTNRAGTWGSTSLRSLL